MFTHRTTPAPGAKLKSLIDDLEEVYMDPPGADEGDSVHRYHRDLHKLLGVATALIAAMEIARPESDQVTDPE